MEALKLSWKYQAVSSFKEMYDWYADNLGSKAADKFSSGILSAIDLLTFNPFMGKREIISDVNADMEFRSFVSHKRHKIIYYIENDTIYIADIWACNMNH